MTVVVMRAHAKVNLYLAIGGRRTDGFHELTSVFHALDLADTVRLSPGSGCTMRMEVPGEVRDEDNLAVRAVEIMGLRNKIALQIDKRIPIAAGMGGGSADAAAAYLGALAASEALLSSDDHQDAMDIGAGLGSDVPFFLARAGTAIVRGRGEYVAPLTVTFQGWFVVGFTLTPLATAEVYARWDEIGGPTGATALDPFLEALASNDAPAIGALLRNDLEAATFDLMPHLAGKKEAMLEAGALGALVAGSGPTLFAVAAGPDHAHDIAEQVADLFDRVHVCGSSAHSIERVR